MYQLNFYVPESHLEEVKNALFAKGAGQIGNYDSCAWETVGQGQFRPLKHSQPFLGEVGKVEPVREYKVEMLCDPKYITQVLQELTDKHPYETPVYSVYKIMTKESFTHKAT